MNEFFDAFLWGIAATAGFIVGLFILAGIASIFATPPTLEELQARLKDFEKEKAAIRESKGRLALVCAACGTPLRINFFTCASCATNNAPLQTEVAILQYEEDMINSSISATEKTIFKLSGDRAREE